MCPLAPNTPSIYNQASRVHRLVTSLLRARFLLTAVMIYATDFRLTCFPWLWSDDCRIGSRSSQVRLTVAVLLPEVKPPSGDNEARQRVEKLLETARPAVPEEKELVTNSIGTKLKLIPAGSFLMGATSDDHEADKDEKPQHKVTITKPFYLGVYEVTQYEYRQVMKDNPSKFKDSELLPVEQVSWLDAVRFCNKLSERERRKPHYEIEDDSVTILGGNGYRLPTEAEWEYACRAPHSPETATKHPFGDSDADLSSFAWFHANSENKTHPVGQKKPNRWGLYDMQGNVWEWCQDRYSADYYTFAPENDPPGPAQASSRVYRGGGWGLTPMVLPPGEPLRDRAG